MKNFRRENQLFSLCGLNCSLCAMHLGGHCGGCGSENCQGCPIARCSAEHDHVQYCVQCPEYPCTKYDDITAYDSFITHQNQLKDLAKFKQMGAECYNQEQTEKRRLLDFLLQHFNNGRKKNFYCLAVNLLEIEDLQQVIAHIKTCDFQTLAHPEQIGQITAMMQRMADARSIILKLRKK